ncbi:MAG: FliH/SctL family protein [Marivibrio sp.]|uniref:hypothetical protein n=1 Tax=Marivibrio sp. TaxID=2039719 RepID=UPI0032ED1C4D
MATKYKPFLFERRFDDFDEAPGARARPANSDAAAWEGDAAARESEEVEAEEPEAPPPPTFSEEELEAAKSAAYDEGRREGLEAGRQEIQQEIDAQIADLLEVVSERMTPLAERQKQAHERAGALMAKIARDIFEKLMPAYAKRYGDEEVVGLVADSLANLQDVGRLSVRVAPEAAEPLAERLEQTVRLAGFEGKLSVIADPSMQSGDAALDWGAGGAERRYRDIWAEIDEAVERAIGDLQAEESPADAADEETPTQAPQDVSPGASADGETDAGTGAPPEGSPDDQEDARPANQADVRDDASAEGPAERLDGSTLDPTRSSEAESAGESAGDDAAQTDTTTQDDASGRPPDDQR